MLSPFLPVQTPTILMITHALGGGVEQHISSLTPKIIKEKYRVLQMRPTNEPDIVQVQSSAIRATATAPLTGSAIPLSEDRTLQALLIERNIRLIHIHHLLGYRLETIERFLALAQNLNIPYDFTVHDYLSICPKINLIDRSGYYCGEPSLSTCEFCLLSDAVTPPAHTVHEHRQIYHRLLGQARRVVVPNQDVKHRLLRYYPDLNIQVIPHPNLTNPATDRTSEELSPAEDALLCFGPKDLKIKRVVLLGNLGLHKGLAVVESMLRQIVKDHLPIELLLIGTSEKNERLTASGLKITGPYDAQDAVKLLKLSQADCVFLSSICPETFSYTLHEVLAANLWPVAFDFGAIADRLSVLNTGTLLPFEWMLSPDKITKALLDLPVQKPEPATIPVQPSTVNGSFLNDYYDWNSR